ncbi:hypothetical protein AB8O64_30270 [Streptomyces sp. QH1-20]|uniref:hypothetical protein n=1 Tax=Streptomyces sp. QH1-20 TaxID=3240934 RepID=UPI003513CCF1
MRISRSRYVAAGLLLGTALTACGQERTGPTAAGPTSNTGAPAPAHSPQGPARGNVEPDAHDGAPHYRENNGFKAPKDMSADSEKAARTEAARIEPVLKRLWTAKTWDAKSVREALLKLGYRNEGPDSEQGRGTLFVQAHDPDRNPGASVALNVRRDACVTAFVQTTNYQVQVNGRFLETGCFEPPSGH